MFSNSHDIFRKGVERLENTSDTLAAKKYMTASEIYNMLGVKELEYGFETGWVHK